MLNNNKGFLIKVTINRLSFIFSKNRYISNKLDNINRIYGYIILSYITTLLYNFNIIIARRKP